MADLFFSKGKLAAVVPFIVFTPQKYIKPEYIVSQTPVQRYCHTVVCLYTTGACELAKLLYSTLVRMSCLSFR